MNTEAGLPAGTRWTFWRSCLAVIGIAVGLALCAGLYLHWKAGQRWSHFLARQERLRAKISVDAKPRVVLLPPATSGNAWDDYWPAMDAIAVRWAARSLKESVADRQIVDGQVSPDQDAAAEVLLLEAGEDLERIRTGARREVLVRPGDSDYVHAYRPIGFLTYSARGQWKRGQAAAAIDEIAVAFQLALDVASPAYGAAPDLLRAPGGALKDFLSRPVETSLAARMVALLDVAEAGFATPSEFAARHSHAFFETLRRNPMNVMEVFGYGTDSRWKRLSFGISPGAFVAGAAETADAWIDDVRRSEAMDMVAADALLWARHGEIIEAYEDLGQRVAEINEIQAYRRSLSRFTLLRAAAQWRLGKTAADPGWPVDPVTCKPVALRDDGKMLRLWSPWGLRGKSRSADLKDGDLVIELEK